MKINSDVRRLQTRANEATKIYILGAKPASLQQYFHKLCDNVNECDLILITDNLRPDASLELLSQLKHHCLILFFNYTFRSYEIALDAFFAKNTATFTPSKRMYTNNTTIKEKTLVVLCNPSSNVPEPPVVSDTSKVISIFLVLKTGGVYNYRYVNAVAKNIREKCTKQFEIVCLTDNPKGITEVDRIVPLKHNWAKWWGKVELFREDVTNNSECIFFDLDTVLIDNIDFLWGIDDSNLYGIRDFYRLDVFQTGVLRWKPSRATNAIYNNFVDNDLYSKFMNRGDHEYLGTTKIDKSFLQDKFPNMAVSYKKTVASLSKKLISPSIVCFHGEPRPHTIKHTFITDHWKY